MKTNFLSKKIIFIDFIMAYTYSIVFEVSPNIHLILKFLDEKVLFLEIGKIEKILHIVLVNVSCVMSVSVLTFLPV